MHACLHSLVDACRIMMNDHAYILRLMLGGFSFSALRQRAVLPLPLAPPPRFLRGLPHPRAVFSSSSSSLPPPPPGMQASAPTRSTLGRSSTPWSTSAPSSQVFFPVLFSLRLCRCFCLVAVPAATLRHLLTSPYAVAIIFRLSVLEQ